MSLRDDVLFFELNGTRSALRAQDVVEVLRAVAIVPLPKAPPVIEGVINVRGTTVPVLDLRRRFGLPLRALGARDHFIVVKLDARAIALRVDHVLGLASIPASDVAAAEPLTARSVHVAGTVKLAEGLALIHDLRSFLDAVEGAALDEALGGTPS